MGDAFAFPRVHELIGKLGRRHGTQDTSEIGDLPPKGQGDLPRPLEDGTFRPVGSLKVELKPSRSQTGMHCGSEDLASQTKCKKCKCDARGVQLH